MAIAIITNFLFFVLPSDSWYQEFFTVLPYTDEPSYTVKVIVGVVINTIVTFTAEKLVSVYFTRWYEKR